MGYLGHSGCHMLAHQALAHHALPSVAHVVLAALGLPAALWLLYVLGRFLPPFRFECSALPRAPLPEVLYAHPVHVGLCALVGSASAAFSLVWGVDIPPHAGFGCLGCCSALIGVRWCSGLVSPLSAAVWACMHAACCFGASLRRWFSLVRCLHCRWGGAVFCVPAGP